MPPARAPSAIGSGVSPHTCGAAGGPSPGRPGPAPRDLGRSAQSPVYSLSEGEPTGPPRSGFSSFSGCEAGLAAS